MCRGRLSRSTRENGARLLLDRPLEHGRVDEGGFGMRVARGVAARAVFDEHTLDALAGDVRQLTLGDEGHTAPLRLRAFRADAPGRPGVAKQRSERGFHSTPPLQFSYA